MSSESVLRWQCQLGTDRGKVCMVLQVEKDSFSFAAQARHTMGASLGQSCSHPWFFVWESHGGTHSKPIRSNELLSAPMSNVQARKLSYGACTSRCAPLRSMTILTVPTTKPAEASTGNAALSCACSPTSSPPTPTVQVPTRPLPPAPPAAVVAAYQISISISSMARSQASKAATRSLTGNERTCRWRQTSMNASQKVRERAEPSLVPSLSLTLTLKSTLSMSQH